MVHHYYAAYRVHRAGRHFDISANGRCLRDMTPVELAQNLDEVYEEMFNSPWCKFGFVSRKC
jgi:hypothetical protein